MTDDDKALVERLRDFVIAEDIDLAAHRIEELSAENERLTQRYNELGNAAMKQVAELGAKVGRLEVENERLHEALREVFEQWAGSEGFIPETAPEGYLLQLTKRMADIARAALGDTK